MWGLEGGSGWERRHNDFNSDFDTIVCRSFYKLIDVLIMFYCYHGFLFPILSF